MLRAELRASRQVGVYRFWRDMGYAVGALIAGVLADAVGFGGAIVIVAALTAASGSWVALDMPGRRSGAPGPSGRDRRAATAS